MAAPCGPSERTGDREVSIYCTSESRPILLAAAAEQFAKYGSRGTRVQDIVNAAGINQRMIYHHFGSKEGFSGLPARSGRCMSAARPRACSRPMCRSGSST